MLNKPDPKTLLRVSKEMPDKLLKVAIQCLQAKTGSPLFSNDDVVIPCLKNFGIDEATEYCVSACWEPYIVGKSLDQNNIAVFDYFPALDEVLRGNYNNWNDLVKAYEEKTKNDLGFFWRVLIIQNGRKIRLFQCLLLVVRIKIFRKGQQNIIIME